MTRLRRRSALRFYLGHPGQLLLSLAGISLGVAVVVAVDLANDTALRAFEVSRELTSPRASHNVESAVGDLDEAVYRQLRVDLGLDMAAPVIEGRVRVGGGSDTSVSLLGIDPVAELAFEESLRLARGQSAARTVDIRTLIAEPGAVVLPERLAMELGVAAGDRLPVVSRGRRQSLRVSALVSLDSNRGSGQTGPVIADISTAQEVLGRIGRLTRIELALTPEQADDVAAALPAGATLVSVDSSEAVTLEMLRAFRINLTALSLLALVVGMLLIYATMSFAIVQRRQSLGTLRALGATREDIARDVLAESACLGAAATAIGLVLGWGLSRSLTELVLATINDLYFSTRVAPRDLALLPFAKAALLGLGATVVAALRPAIEAAQEPARSAMTRAAYERRMRRRFSASPVLSAVGFFGAIVLIAWPSSGLVAAFGGLFLVLAGYALIVPAAMARLLTLLQAASGRTLGLSVRLAVRGAVASLSRTGIAVTALAVAVATVVGIGVMIDSFRASVAEWLERSLMADYYLVTRDAEAGGFTETEISALRRTDGVEGISLSRTIELSTAGGTVALRVARAGPKGYGEELLAGDPSEAFPALDSGRAILLAEPFARRRGLTVDDTLNLPSPEGDMAFRVAGIFRDYRTSGSAAMLPYGVFSRIWGYLPPLGLGIYVDEKSDRAAVERALETFATERGETNLIANREIRQITLEIFDRTFEITGVLRLLAGIIAFFGILSSLLALQLERSREVATLRAIGFTRAQAGGNSLAQTTLLGIVSGLLALPLGVILAALLIYVINQRSFGWSMGFVVEPAQLLTGLALAVLAAFLAGLYPARRLAEQAIGANLRGE